MCINRLHIIQHFISQAASGKASDEDGPVLVPNPNGRDSRLKAEKDLKVIQ